MVTHVVVVTDRELLAGIEASLQELRRRGVARTSNAPTGDYAESLALKVLGGELASNSAKSYDLVTAAGDRIQVKARVIRNGSAGERQLSPFRSFDFEHALIILFDSEYRVRRATMLPAAIVLAHSTDNAYINARRFIARDAVLDLGTDLTHLFQEDHTITEAG